jgi:hypothetical protein
MVGGMNHTAKLRNLPLYNFECSYKQLLGDKNNGYCVGDRAHVLPLDHEGGPLHSVTTC